MSNKKKTKKSKKKFEKLEAPNAGAVKLVKVGNDMFLPVSSKLLKLIGANPLSQFYWTAVDGVLQLTTEFPVMVISVLDRPEERFEAQRV
jgi:hypothetical protein